jgi:hypothetical protein
VTHPTTVTARAACLALVGAFWLGSSTPAARQATSAPRAPRVAVFFERGFPAVDVDPIPESELREALAGRDATFLPADRLAAELDASRFDVLVTPFGSAFPADAWPAILAYLQAGGNWVNLGGRPFGVPVWRFPGGWTAASPSSAYYKKLGFTHVFEVPGRAVSSWKIADGAGIDFPLPSGLRADAVFETDIRLANTKDFPDEDGSDGQREGRIRPLVVGLDANGTPIAAPVVRVDRLAGSFAGGAWILANLRGHVSPAAARGLVDAAVPGGFEFVARPTFAGFLPGETPTIELRITRPGRIAGGLAHGPASIVVLDPAGRALFATKATMTGAGAFAAVTVPLPAGDRGWPKGFCEVRAVIETDVPGAANPVARVEATTGFWVYDLGMLEGGTPLAAGRDSFTRGGRPFPVTGTTYMASDVHRRFLLEPNPYLWRRDVAAMKAAGVNAIRTGIWTGWALHMPEVGAFSEAALRSLDIFLLTARQHDVPVIFTLFAFLPEAWGGENPYLDPRAVFAQQAFAGVLARRYARANDLSWDLINEPSFSSPLQLWKTRPNYDASERAAWDEWVRARYPAGGGNVGAAARAAWGATADEDLDLPTLDDFADRNLFGPARPLKAADYKRFAQDMFARWTRQLAGALRANGNSAQLVTVGQDEGGLTERPNPLLFGRDVDYTCMHTWWNNDALAWDAILARRPDRPLLVEETGLMRYERTDGTAWRTEADAAALLERKLALAVGTGAAGYVQWIWNTNPYMASDNEAGIGFVRADGTARPELQPFVDLSRFLASHAPRFRGRQLEDVVLLVPHSQMFSVRNLATEATQRAVRVLTSHLGVPIRAVSELALDDTLGAPRLIVAPAPRVLTSRAWQTLLQAVDRGATLVVTGIVDADERWQDVPRMRGLGLDAGSRPVAGDESIAIDGRVHHLAYRGDRLERLEIATVPGPGGPAVHVVRHGAGSVLWSPLPVELAQAAEATEALYRLAIRYAGVRPPVTVEPAEPGVFVGASVYEDAVLVTLVSESGGDRALRVSTVAGRSGHPVRLPAGRAALLLFDRKTGTLIASHLPR